MEQYKEHVSRLKLLLHKQESNEIVFACPRSEEERLFLQIHEKINGSTLLVVQTSEALFGCLALKMC